MTTNFEINTLEKCVQTLGKKFSCHIKAIQKRVEEVGMSFEPRTLIEYDLKDDDEDGDKKIDMEVTFYLTGNTLFRDVSYNEEGFGNHIKKLLDNVTFLNFVYWGSKKEDLGKNIDLGNDGIAGTDDEGEDDGLISETEIDMVAPPTGHGNQNGSIDTEEERMYIASIYLEIGYDKNGDGVEDARLKTELSPPLLVLKNKQ